MGLARQVNGRYLLAWALVLTIVIAAIVQTSTALGQVASGATLTALRGPISVVRSDGSVDDELRQRRRVTLASDAAP